jgi:hypothetical protein
MYAARRNRRRSIPERASTNTSPRRRTSSPPGKCWRGGRGRSVEGHLQQPLDRAGVTSVCAAAKGKPAAERLATLPGAGSPATSSTVNDSPSTGAASRAMHERRALRPPDDQRIVKLRAISRSSARTRICAAAPTRRCWRPRATRRRARRRNRAAFPAGRSAAGGRSFTPADARRPSPSPPPAGRAHTAQ